MKRLPFQAATLLVVALAGAATTISGSGGARRSPADLVLTGRIYTLAWPDPAPDGTPAAAAPRDASGRWHPDAEAIAITGGRIVYVGSVAGVREFTGSSTRTIAVPAASTILPGMVDAHVHAFELGASLERVNLVGVKTEVEAVDRVAARARTVPKGEWIVGWGWDEGAWANRYPDMRSLSARVPDHPVYLRGLHSYAAWGNRLAFERAGITKDTPSPPSGEIRKDASGQPTGILLNNASRLLERAVPEPTPERLKSRLAAALKTLAAAGYVTVHEAGADGHQMKALEDLAAADALPMRVYAMLAARDEALLDAWRTRGPDRDDERMLVTRSVKAFYDGALGSRGALLLDDYSDRPGHRGERDRTFNPDRLEPMITAGFQVAIHAIGDAANRQVLDFFEGIGRDFVPINLKARRHRLEHAQVMAPADIPRMARDGIIASMQPPHAVEDMPWAEARVGAERITGAYAWRSMRRAGVRLVFSSDLPGSDYNLFYGLHSAVTRQDRAGQPAGGWHAEQTVTMDEALRGYTTWAAYAALREGRTGTLAPGRWADLTVISVDPFNASPEALLRGAIDLTIVNGRVVFSR
jgi:predicted amidohydrolase YtcJ